MKPLLSVLLIFLVLGCGRTSRSEVTRICTQVSGNCPTLRLCKGGTPQTTAEQKEPASAANPALPISVMDFSISLLTY